MAGVIAAYNANESEGLVLDRSGHGYHIDLSGSNVVRSIDGNPGNSLTKAAPGGDGVLPSSLLTASQTPTRAVMLDMKGNGTTWIIRWNIASIDSGGWGILTLDGVEIGLQARYADGYERALAPIPDTDNWHHYCATYDGARAYFYVDGVRVRDVDVHGLPLRTDATSLDILGEQGPGTYIDNIRILDYCPTDAEVAEFAATPVPNAQVREIAQIVETETVEDLTYHRGKTLGLIQEQDVPLALVGGATRKQILGLVEEVETPRAPRGGRARALVQTIEQDYALEARGFKRKRLARLQETNTAYAMGTAGSATFLNQDLRLTATVAVSYSLVSTLDTLSVTAQVAGR